MTKFSLHNKGLVLTGGGSGIGEAIALTFARQGATVYIWDFNIEAAEETVKQIEFEGFSAKAYACDISKQNEVNECIDKIAKLNSIDILINNAGIAHVGNIEAVEEADLDRLYEVNIKGIYNCTKACIHYMKSKGGGSILNLASIASSVVIFDRFAYSMTKGAVLTMTLSVAKDYLAHNIRCNCISPASVHTQFVDGFIKKNYPGEEQKCLINFPKHNP